MLGSIFHDIDIILKSHFYCENIKIISLLWTTLTLAIFVNTRGYMALYHSKMRCKIVCLFQQIYSRIS